MEVGDMGANMTDLLCDWSGDDRGEGVNGGVRRSAVKDKSVRF